MAKNGGEKSASDNNNRAEMRGGQKTASRSEMIEGLIQQACQKVRSKDCKVSVGDLIRLLQYKQELEAEQPKEIRVTWIDPPKTES